jgi:hypothetical protein
MVGHVACLERVINAYKILVERLPVDAKITLEWILEKYCGKVLTEFVWLRTGTSFKLL